MNISRSIYILSMVLLAMGVKAHGGDTITYEQMGGIYYAYHYDSTLTETQVPEGFRPFYISHFGRHGSRWLPSDERYERVLESFADTTALTPLGKDVRRRLLLIWEDAKGRGGDLTILGTRQQEGIAERMFSRWPEVLDGDVCVSARSSIVGRCIMSMNAFLLRLQSLNTHMKITAEANRRYMPYIAYSSPQEDSLIAHTPRVININPDRLISSLFNDPSCVASPIDLLSELHCIASDMQNTTCGVSLYDIFTPQEMRAVYDANNMNMWTCNTCNDISGDIPARSALSLWHNIVQSADEAIANG
ncbi:MAG: histidine-type phosphatase, partial [Prevotella sp.]